MFVEPPLAVTSYATFNICLSESREVLGMRCIQLQHIHDSSPWARCVPLTKVILSKPERIQKEQRAANELNVAFKPTQVLEFEEVQVQLIPVANGVLEDMRRDKTWAPKAYARLCYELCCQLQKAHARGMIHNNIAMHNVFILNGNLFLENWGEVIYVDTDLPEEGQGNIYRKPPEMYDIEV